MFLITVIQLMDHCSFISVEKDLAQDLQDMHFN
jgi:hypothetical protein